MPDTSPPPFVPFHKQVFPVCSRSLRLKHLNSCIVPGCTCSALPLTLISTTVSAREIDARTRIERTSGADTPSPGTSEDDEPCECHSIRRSPPRAAPQPTSPSPSPSPVRVDYTTPRHVSQTSQTPQDHSQSDTPRELPSTPPSSPPPSSLPSSSTSHRNRQQLVFTVVEQRPTSFDIAHPESDTPCEPPSTKSSQSPHPSPPLASSPCRKRPFAFTVREPTSPAKRPRQRSEQEGTESATSTSQTPTLADEPTPPTLEETEPGVSLAASTSNTSLSSIVSSSSDCDRYEDAPSLRIRRFVSKIKSLKVNFTWFEASGNEPLSSAPSFPAKVGDVFLYKHRGHPSLPDLDLNDRELLVAVQI